MVQEVLLLSLPLVKWIQPVFDLETQPAIGVELWSAYVYPNPHSQVIFG